MRITHCSFNGYRDIAIDSRGSERFPFLLATIDHCLFFDARPGFPADPPSSDGKLPFVNRGAINIDSVEAPRQPGDTSTDRPQLPSHSQVSVADNSFIDVWRRCPRIATNNFGHILNNIVFRWGAGNDNTGDSAAEIEREGTDTWRCIEIGGGDGVTRGNNGSALIEANRFIPADLPGRSDLAKTIAIKTGTLVDIGLSPPRQPNRFDDKDGEQRNVTFPVPAQGLSTIRQLTFPPATVHTQTGQEISTEFATPTPVNTVDWSDLVRQSGPAGSDGQTIPEQIARKLLLDVLDR